MVLTMQVEVAERICAQAGDMSLLAVSVQFYGIPKLMTKIPPEVFFPRPDVDSAVLRIDVYDKPIVDIPDEQTFFRVVRAGFSQKRKQLRNSLSGGLQIKSKQADDLLERAEIDPQRRAETLTIEEWARVTQVYTSASN
jgi:16S rRNA (adenine1518-N6/adenine1519-N6)-dimethyltransferase